MIRPPTLSALAADGSSACTSMRSSARKGANGSHALFINSRSSPTAVAADFRWRQPRTSIVGDFVSVGRQHTAHLRDAGVVGPARSSDEAGASHDEHIAAIDGAGRFDVEQGAMRPERVGDGRRFHTPRNGTGPREDGHFVEDDRRVLDEDRVRHLGSCREPLDTAPGAGQTGLVRAVLGARQGQVDRRALEMGQLTAPDGRTQVAGQSDEHSESSNWIIG